MPGRALEQPGAGRATSTTSSPTCSFAGRSAAARAGRRRVDVRADLCRPRAGATARADRCATSTSHPAVPLSAQLPDRGPRVRRAAAAVREAVYGACTSALTTRRARRRRRIRRPPTAGRSSKSSADNRRRACRRSGADRVSGTERCRGQSPFKHRSDFGIAGRCATAPKSGPGLSGDCPRIRVYYRVFMPRSQFSPRRRRAGGSALVALAPATAPAQLGAFPSRSPRSSRATACAPAAPCAPRCR